MKKPKSEQELINHLKTRSPKLTDDEVSEVISGLRKFVVLVQKIYTQPQARLSYIEKTLKGHSKKEKVLVVKTTMEELVKARVGSSESIEKLFPRFIEKVTKGKK